MGAEYKLFLMNPAGVRLAELTEFRSLTYTRRVNAPGLLRFELDGASPKADLLTLDSQVEVWRRLPGIVGWYRDFVGLFRAEERSASGGKETFVATCVGPMALLGRRIVNWPAGTTNRAAFTNRPAETIMKTLVAYNAGANATTANGRHRNGRIPSITLTADQGRGNVLTWNCAYANVLEELQKLAEVAGGDFSLEKTAANTFTFEFHPGQLGADRRTTVIFALERGNMENPKYSLDRTDEKTVAVVGGRGEGSEREIVTRTGAAYSATNDIEVFVDSRNEDATAGLSAKGDAALAKGAAKERFSFDVLQTPSTRYGVHYHLGDIVTAKYRSITVYPKVVGVTVAVNEDGLEEIGVELL